MANPNLLGITNITGVTTNVGLTTTPVTVLSNAAASGAAYKIISILASNKNGVSNGNIDIFLNNQAAGAGSSTHITKAVTVSAGSMLIVLDKNNPLYLTENKSLVSMASTSNTIDITVVYENIS